MPASWNRRTPRHLGQQVEPVSAYSPVGGRRSGKRKGRSFGVFTPLLLPYGGLWRDSPRQLDSTPSPGNRCVHSGKQILRLSATVVLVRSARLRHEGSFSFCGADRKQ